MKRVLIFCMLITVAGRSFSQSLEDINKLMDKNQFAAAKIQIDKYTTDPKTGLDAFGWYYKGRIYNSLSRDAATPKADAYQYKLAAFDAFQKYQQMDKLDIRMKAEFWKSYLDLYLGLYDLGAQQFSAKDYSSAYKSFSKAQDIENFILSRNYTYDEIKLTKMDTSLVMNTGASALQANDTINAVKSYRKITDANITGKDYEEVYEYLAGYYSRHNDQPNLQAIMNKGKAAYPNNSVWNQLEVEALTGSGDKKAMFAKYDELFKQDPSNFTNTYNYAAELYNNLYGKDASENPDPAMKDKLTEVLKAAMINDTKGMDASVLMVNHLYNDAAAYSSAAALVKGSKPDDVKKKKELNALSDAKMNEAIPYAEKVLKFYSEQTGLSTRQKVDYRAVAETMSDIYTAKGNLKKAAEYDKIKEGIKFN